MKKIIMITIMSVLGVQSPAFAKTACADILPQVTLQLTAEQWVITQTAKVNIALDALLNKEQLAKAQENFQMALKKIAPEGEWHIIEFSRATSKTNLEQLHAVAQARLPSSALAGLRDHAKAQSSEGQTYTVQDILYTPTLAEISAAQAALRAEIYNQAKAELDRLNAVYPKQSYNLYQINFVNVPTQPGPMIMAKMNTPTPEMAQQVTQEALVVLAAPGALCQ